MILKHLEDNGYDLSSNSSSGISVVVIDNEVVLRGSKLDLIELADYLLDVALSANKTDHMHIDKATLLSNQSDMDCLILEKE